MSSADAADGGAPISARRMALRLVPLAALGTTVVVVVLAALTMPSTSSRSGGAVVHVAIIFAVAIGACCLMAAFSVDGTRAVRVSILTLAALVLVALGRLVSSRIDTAWRDACDFGGAGDRCIAHSGAAPTWAIVVWPIVGALGAASCAAIVRVGRLAALPE